MNNMTPEEQSDLELLATFRGMLIREHERKMGRALTDEERLQYTMARMHALQVIDPPFYHGVLYT